MREDLQVGFEIADRMLATRRAGEEEGFERGVRLGRAEGDAAGYTRGVAAATEAFGGALREFLASVARGAVASDAAACGDDGGDPSRAGEATGGAMPVEASVGGTLTAGPSAAGEADKVPDPDAGGASQGGGGDGDGATGAVDAGLPLVGGAGSAGATGGAPAPREAVPAAPAVAPPFPAGCLDGMNRSEVRVFNVVAAMPVGRMNVAFVAKEAEVKAGPAADALRQFVAKGMIVRKGDYYMPADGFAGASKLSTAFLRNSDELPERSYQMRAMLYAVAVLGRANAGEVAAQAKIKPGSSDVMRGLTLLTNERRLVVTTEGYALPEGLTKRVERAEGAANGSEDEDTFAMVKCGAVARGDADAILAMAVAAGLRPMDVRKVALPRGIAEGIYEAHAGKDYHARLIASVCDGEVVVARLRGRDAARTWRAALGATDPASAEPDTVRGRYGKGIPDNAAHGSDGPEAAARELALVAPLFTGGDAAP